MSKYIFCRSRRHSSAVTLAIPVQSCAKPSLWGWLSLLFCAWHCWWAQSSGTACSHSILCCCLFQMLYLGEWLPLADQSLASCPIPLEGQPEKLLVPTLPHHPAAAEAEWGLVGCLHLCVQTAWWGFFSLLTWKFDPLTKACSFGLFLGRDLIAHGCSIFSCYWNLFISLSIVPNVF